MKLVWTEVALSTIEEIREHVTTEVGEEAARSLVERIMASVEHLSRFPRSGRIIPDFSEPTSRELITRSYRVIYHLDSVDSPSKITICGVLHGSRLLENTPAWPLLDENGTDDD